jgi:hypothetical protein
MSEPSHKSQSAMRTSVTDAYRENYERIHGEKPVQRGRWVWDNAKGELVPAHEYGFKDEPEARTEISMDRHYENMGATDGTDIGSRRKHREYMKRHGLAMADDFKGEWAEAAKEREAYLTGQKRDAATREAVGRAEYELSKKRRR